MRSLSSVDDDRDPALLVERTPAPLGYSGKGSGGPGTRYRVAGPPGPPFRRAPDRAACFLARNFSTRRACAHGLEQMRWLARRC